MLRVAPAFSQQQTAGGQQKPAAAVHPPDVLKPQEIGQSESAAAQDEQEVLPGDWGPELLYNILSSQNEEARDALYGAAFAAGSSVVPQLEAALKDDRTAEFAAQVLAYIGGPKAFELLTRVVADTRDLNLRRFYYGALAEFQVPDASDILLTAIEKADAEPDRTVTQTAIIALTVQSNSTLVSKLRSVEARIQDPVIRDDLDNATAVIQERARYLASPAGQNASGSLDQAVRSYFMPALQTAGVESTASSAASRSTPIRKLPETASARQSYTAQVHHPDGNSDRTAKSPNSKRAVQVEIRHLAFSPEKTRALARVSFEDSSAVADYDMVLQKRGGSWILASVWLESERERASTSEGTTRNTTQFKK
jgi:hypothetical protein